MLELALIDVWSWSEQYCSPTQHNAMLVVHKGEACL